MSDSRDALRRTPEELFNTYRLNPEFRDLIVEGRSDAKWLRWLCSELGIAAKVFAVDDRVSIDRETTLKFHREVNARGRAMAFAELAARSDCRDPNVTVIVDSDFDIVDNARENSKPANPCVLHTDYPSFEVYAMLERPFGKFLATVVDTERSIESVLRAILPALTTVFAVRYIVHRCDLHTSVPKKIFDAARVTESALEMTARDLLGRCSPSLNNSDLQYANQKFVEIQGKLAEMDALTRVHGHDIAPALTRYFNLKMPGSNAQVVESQLVQCLELSDLVTQPMIKRLVDRLGRN